MIVWAFLVLTGVVWSSDENRTTTHLNHPHFLLKNAFENNIETLHQEMDNEKQTKKNPYPRVREEWFSQKVDHLNSQDHRIWNQRWIYNDQFWGYNDMFFLYIGGMEELEKRWAGDENMPHMRWAQKYRAMVFGLEHRFFGKSFPFNNLDITSLKYLSIEQVLEDIVYFINGMNKKFAYEGLKYRWFIFGGGYSGTLCAFLRAKYPDVTVGAWSSSAPVNFKFDFYEFVMGIENSIMLNIPDCSKNIENAFNKMNQFSMSVDGRNRLNQYFDVTPKFDENTVLLDLTHFFAQLYRVFERVVAYSYVGESPKYQTELTVKKLCEKMTDSSEQDEIARVVNVWKWFLDFFPIGPTKKFPNNYKGVVEQFRRQRQHMPDHGQFRSSFWLLCTQLGFMQTTDLGRNLFGSVVNLNYFVDLCYDIFEPAPMDIITIRDGIDAANKKYDMGRGATNTIFTYGTLDPWKELGKTTSDPSAKLYVLFIEGTSHTADLFAPFAGEPPALADARNEIEKHLVEFINP